MESNAQLISFLAPLLGVVIGGLITITATFVPLWWKRREDKRTMAQSLSFDLDVFAVACAEIVEDNEDKTQKYPSSTVVPEVPQLRNDLNSSTLRRDLYTRHNEIRLLEKLSASHIRFYETDLGEREWAADQTADYCAKLGFDALILARDIREYVGISEPNYSHLSWDFEKVLRERSNRVEAKKIESKG
ncbi:hypothetical protein [Roseovarius sp. MBR-6]|jgi:hypothetical protein|uniref:hypothetical protein n=1 Tax=Roseovarius sp. MBR-6 TaxID=3156459 RepID=UPI003392DC6F